MRAHCVVVALMAFPACIDAPGDSTESASSHLNAAETAQWTRVGNSTLPEARFGQAVALDETRGVLVMFGGVAGGISSTPAPRQDLWEWDPALSTWKLRPAVGTAPEARSGAAMAYDSTRKVFVLFGGRPGSGYDLQDTWEWDPATGAWADKTGAGTPPAARSQHGMIFDSKNGKVVLFGGGRSQLGAGNWTELYAGFADTWEYDGTHWTQRTTATAPSARAGFGFASSGSSGKAYLFGGLEILAANAPGTPKQDSWEYDGTAGTWTERTAAGSKPSARFGHSMAIDSVNGQAVVFGGFDISTSGSKNDVWTWNLASGAWQGHDGVGASPWPGKRKWASLVKGAENHLYLVAGLLGDSGAGYDAGVPFGSSNVGSREVWDLNPSTTTWVDRSAPNDSPSPRQSHAMTADPVTGKVYLFGGANNTGYAFNDLWEWNGSKWVECTGDVKPPARAESAMSYDPARKSLILFGGNQLGMYGSLLDDTWEWNIGTRTWKQLAPTVSPSGRSSHSMVTDTARQKIILVGGNIMMWYGTASGTIFEWDGAASTWTDRSSSTGMNNPGLYSSLSLVYDEGRKVVVLLGASGSSSSMGDTWEWDPLTGSWQQRPATGSINLMYGIAAAFDSIRRRTVAVGMPSNPMMSPTLLSTYEVDSTGPTWYPRTILGAPNGRYAPRLAFDNQRGVVVLFGGMSQETGMLMDDTWEYRVDSWDNGSGCTAAFASHCSSGNCVDGVCCESASCTGACKSCNVAGKAGTCVLATPGTQVPGSCAGDLACDVTGNCRTSNGKACSSSSECASGFCVDGVCCNTGCTGTCVSCTQPGRTGTCTPFAAGTDPRNQCSLGTPPCQSACNGQGGCSYPRGSACGSCGICDGLGSCMEQWYCAYDGGPRPGPDTGPTFDGGPRDVAYDLPPDRQPEGGLAGRGGNDGGTGGFGGNSADAGRIDASGVGGSGGTAGITGTGSSGFAGTSGTGASGGIGSGGITGQGGVSGSTTFSATTGVRDGGLPLRDGGSLLDGGRTDGSSDGRTDASSGKLGQGGCSCRLSDTRSPQGLSLLLLFGLAWLTRRIRRPRS
jgi:MYXO-CTERM domain-containing protein